MFCNTVKHVYFASIKFSRLIKYMRIFGIAHHHDFVCIEYQLFRDIIRNDMQYSWYYIM